MSFERERTIAGVNTLGPVDLALPERAFEIGEQIVQVILGLQELGLPRDGWINRFYATPEDEDGKQSVSLQRDGYPGVGVIMSVAAASITRNREGFWTYNRRTETSHSGRGAESFEEIAFTREDLLVRQHSKPGYQARHTWRTENYSWRNQPDRPQIEIALDSFSSALGRWGDEVRTYIGGHDSLPRVEAKFPQTFRRNVIPFTQERM